MRIIPTFVTNKSQSVTLKPGDKGGLSIKPESDNDDQRDNEGEAPVKRKNQPPFTYSGQDETEDDDEEDDGPKPEEATKASGYTKKAGQAGTSNVSPPGWKGTTEAMKKHPEISNPFALAWAEANKGDKPHYTAKGKKKPTKNVHEGFAAVEESAAESGASDPAAVAAAIGRKKYGAAKMARAAAKGKPLKEGQKKRKATHNYQAVTLNLKGPIIRHDTLEGRPHMVVPCVMLTEGVHNGSAGPLYYPPDELGKLPLIWNMKPVVVYHPEMDGHGISACDPVVINNRKIGVVLNTEYDGKGRLIGEAWLEEGRIKKVDSRILDSLNSGKMVELSTGLFTDNDPVAGVWNGEPYVAVARNYKPDHLAILPDQKGACSIDDGAGLLRNKGQGQGSHEDLRDALQSELRSLRGGGKEFGGPYVCDVFDDCFVYRGENDKQYSQEYTNDDGEIQFNGDPKEVKKITQYQDADSGDVIGNREIPTNQEGDMSREAVVNRLISNLKTPWEEKDRPFLMGASEKQFAIITANGPSVVDTEPDIDDDEEWHRDTDKNKVPRPKKREPKDILNLAESDSDGDDDSKDDEDDDMTDKKEKSGKKGKKPMMNVETYVAKAPREIREFLGQGLRTAAQQKENLISNITGNPRNIFTKPALVNKSLDELHAIARLAGPTENGHAVSYAGLADAMGADDLIANIANIDEGEMPTLGLPVLNFSQEGKK